MWQDFKHQKSKGRGKDKEKAILRVASTLE